MPTIRRNGEELRVPSDEAEALGEFVLPTLEELALTAGDPAPERRGEGIFAYTYRRGFTMRDGYAFRAPEGYTLSDQWSDEPYRLVWTSWRAGVILTYCEGDVDIEEYDTHSGYLAGVDRADRFYCPQHHGQETRP